MTSTLDRSRKAAVSAGIILIVAACSGSSAATTAPSASAAAPSMSAAATASASAAASTAASPSAAAVSVYDQDLSAVCPKTVVVQTNWFPEVDHAWTYQALGPNGTIDANKLTYTGPLGKTGINLEIRAGGPAIGYQQVSAILYQDPSILLGYVGTDEAIQNSKSQPTTAVFGEPAKNPQAIIWGDDSWNFQSVADIGKSGATYLAFPGSTYLDVWTAEGLLNKSQIDTSYQGGEARFIAEKGKITQQAFVTSEPYRLEHETKEWDKPVHYLTFGDAFPVYQSALSIRSDKLEANRACLQKLIPIFQQATVDYVANPQPINDLLVKYVAQIQGGGFTLSAGLAADAYKKSIDLGLIGNGTDGVVGSFDTARLQGLIDRIGPAITKSGKAIKDGLTPADLATNDFLSKSIALP